MSPRSDERPLIGLTTYREVATWGVWNTSADLLPTAYAQSLEAAGGVPVLLPPLATDAAVAVAGRLDGLVISGGADVDPRRYAVRPHPRTAAWRADRDAWELALLDAAGATALPVLGICRGMQVMAVQRGGVLDQHTPDLVGHEGHSPGGDTYGETRVQTLQASRVRALIGPSVRVSCHHHQSVREHPGFVPAAYADDGTLEAMEDPDHAFCLAVQWHPETREDSGLFSGLVEAARR
jgi:putative glutamine amidotransferase